MKQLPILLSLISVAILTVLVFNSIIKAKQLPVVPTLPTMSPSQPTNQSPGNYPSQTKSFGAVEITVVPKKLITGEESIFTISLNTHSVELSFDFTQIASLIDDQGNKYKAVSWNGGRGGHHLNGELTFESLKEDTTQITLNLQEIDGISDNFSFDISPDA